MNTTVSSTRSGHVSTSERILEAMARHEDVDLLSRGERLHDVVDPDALDALTGREGVTVEFEFRGCIVSVDEEGSVDVADAH